MKKLVKLCLSIIILITLSCSNDDDNQNLIVDTSTADIINAISGDLVGKSILNRFENNISVNYTTSGLIPNHAYTLWWVIWNKKENCAGYPAPCADTDFAIEDQVEVELLYATGLVADSNGQIRFSAQLNENNSSESINDLFGLPTFGGLQSAKSAEVHVVLRSHGPVISGQENEQIQSYEGGCTTFFAPFTEIPDDIGECGDFQFAIHQ